MSNGKYTFNRRAMLKLSGAVIGAVALTRGNVARAASDPALIEAAKAEGSVTLYSSASTGPTNALAEAFRAKYGIDVTVYRAGSSEVAARVQGEEAAGRTEADALIIEPPALGLLEPYLAEYDSPERGTIADAFKFPKSTLIRMYVAEIAWNSQMIAEGDAPMDWQALTDPKWKGRIGSLDPHVTATTLSWQVMVTDLYGPGYLEAFGANMPKLYSSTNAMTQAIVTGEIEAGVTNSFGVLQLAATGAPITGVIPTETVLFGGHISVFEKAPHPNAARLLCDFAISDEGQTIINSAGYTIPSHPDAVVPEVTPLSELTSAHMLVQPDYAMIIAETQNLLTEWEKYVQ